MVDTKVDADGLLYLWDADREKYLSVARATLIMNSTQPGHLWAMQTAGVGQASGRNPYIMPRDGTITSIYGMSEQVNSQDMIIYFYDQGGPANRHDDHLFPQTGADASEVVISGSTNYDVSEGDWLRAASFRAEDSGSPGSIVFPIVCVEISWRTS